MRILAFTDVHASQAALHDLAARAQQADLLLCAGDLSVFGMELYEVLTTINSWNKPVFLIHGNHEDEDILVDVNIEFSNIHFVHKKEKQFGELTVVGWGGGGFAREDPDLASFAKQLKPRNNRILMFHGPPYGTTVDFKEGWDYTGCKTRRTVIEKVKPFLVLCGHIHENFGNQDKIGDSLILNPGPSGKFIDVQGKAPNKKA